MMALSLPTTEGSSKGATATSGITKEAEMEERLKEEQEALAQAETWMAIAEQSKKKESLERK